MTSTLSVKPASSTWAIFSDQSFSFETLRALGYAPYGGADIGEITSTMRLALGMPPDIFDHPLPQAGAGDRHVA